mmetsp:Transcript_181807/g.577014  ORF Transcript_181807/g.577014 Transcript_181807/m.577014 type:complete len:270 (+) Transcript_181807:135-944(+)
MGRTTAMTSTVGAAPMTKGQRSLRGYREPAPARPLPAELRSEAVLCFDARRFDLAGAVASLLGLPSAAVLETYVVEEDSISGRSFPKSVHDRVRNSAEFVERYEALIREVVGPHLLSFFPGFRPRCGCIVRWIHPRCLVGCTATTSMGTRPARSTFGCHSLTSRRRRLCGRRAPQGSRIGGRSWSRPGRSRGSTVALAGTSRGPTAPAGRGSPWTSAARQGVPSMRSGSCPAWRTVTRCERCSSPPLNPMRMRDVGEKSWTSEGRSDSF